MSRYETLLDWMRGAFPNHPVASLRRVAAMYQNEGVAEITRVLQKMMDDEAFSSSEVEFPIFEIYCRSKSVLLTPFYQ